MKSVVPRLPPGDEPEQEVKLSFVDHLRELRRRLVHALAGLAVGMALVGWFVPRIVDAVLAPVRHALPEGKQTLIYTSAIEPMMVYIKVAIYGGLFVAAPWVLWQLWLFIAPGLYKRERRIVFPFIAWATLLFYAGAAFCYFFVLPPAFPAILAFAGEGTHLAPMLSLSEQLSLVLAMLLGFAIIFEVPVVIAFLSMIGLVDHRWLARYRRHAIIVNVVAAAILTPTGDPFNLALMALPMIVFYEIGIILARVLGKKKPAGAPSPG